MKTRQLLAVSWSRPNCRTQRRALVARRPWGRSSAHVHAAQALRLVRLMRAGDRMTFAGGGNWIR